MLIKEERTYQKYRRSRRSIGFLGNELSCHEKTITRLCGGQGGDRPPDCKEDEKFKMNPNIVKLITFSKISQFHAQKFSFLEKFKN